jgi:pimeloyl-ACP methyl ester carboxylesterase
VLRGAIIIIVSVVGALYAVFPVAMGIAAVWPSRSQPGPTPTGFRDVTITTADGVRLAAWYAESGNGAAIILVHGAGTSRADVRRQALMLQRHGYGVLAIDVRGHGRSGGVTNRLGWPGTPDVRAAVNFLRSRGVERIGALGESMGGEVLLGASASCPEIGAIVADGATRRSVGELVALPSERPLVRNFTARVFFGAVGLFTLSAPPPPLLAEMQAADATSFYFIAAGNVPQEVAFNRVFKQATTGTSELWVVPRIGHTQAARIRPQEYERRIVAFFDERLSVAAYQSSSRR